MGWQISRFPHVTRHQYIFVFWNRIGWSCSSHMRNGNRKDAEIPGSGGIHFILGYVSVHSQLFLLFHWRWQNLSFIARSFPHLFCQLLHGDVGYLSGWRLKRSSHSIFPGLDWYDSAGELSSCGRVYKGASSSWDPSDVFSQRTEHFGGNCSSCSWLRHVAQWRLFLPEDDEP